MIRRRLAAVLRRIARLAEGVPICLGECGQPLSESTNPENEGRYSVPPPTRCHACTALAEAKENHARAHPECLTWTVELGQPIKVDGAGYAKFDYHDYVDDL